MQTHSSHPRHVSPVSPAVSWLLCLELPTPHAPQAASPHSASLPFPWHVELGLSCGSSWKIAFSPPLPPSSSWDQVLWIPPLYFLSDLFLLSGFSAPAACPKPSLSTDPTLPQRAHNWETESQEAWPQDLPECPPATADSCPLFLPEAL